ncbi:hypothetical protein [Shimia thalassica]|uniref:hypothetical protein n=1 Tax=Shimia thalassica TaxID=1715693 RepID=UPI0026E26D1A|nr:hypothetical protein [Shimia thalassica]MDO6483463.1 hypothetical protein [Shimia thalassica]
MRLLASFLLILSTTAQAEIRDVPYSVLSERLDNRITFETLPRRPEPGFNLDHPLRSTGAWMGERFKGQSLTQSMSASKIPHDALGQESAYRPLSIQAGPKNRNLSIAYHRGFGSNAVLPLGPDGFSNLSGRGEGALAVLFDTDQRSVGFRVHTDYAAPLGQKPDRGHITVYFMTRMGHLLETRVLSPDLGISEFGFETSDQRARIAGILMTNTDPGGIAIDDILFQIEMMLF